MKRTMTRTDWRPFAISMLCLAALVACGPEVAPTPSPWTDESRSASFADVHDAASIADVADTSFVADAAAAVDALAFAVAEVAPVQVGASRGFRMVTVADGSDGSVAASPRFTLYVAPGG